MCVCNAFIYSLYMCVCHCVCNAFIYSYLTLSEVNVHVHVTVMLLVNLLCTCRCFLVQWVSVSVFFILLQLFILRTSPPLAD